jgi:hypothetical protein
MKLRNVAITLAAATAIAGSAGVSLIAAASDAGATSYNAITVLSPDPITGDTVTPGTPFSAGQTVEVSVPANSSLPPNGAVTIIECADPGGLVGNLPSGPTALAHCDTTTANGNSVTIGADGSFNDPQYQVYALGSGPFFSGSPTSCGSAAVPCVLWIGYNYNNFASQQVWSQPFQVVDDGNTDGANPGDGTPEVPLAVGLPLAAAGLFAGGLAIRRRRSAKAAA